MNFEKNKLVVIGAGMVGSSVLNTALSLNLLSEIVLIDKNGNRARGEALDSSHTTSFAYSPNTLVREGDYEDCKDAQIIVITAGPSIKPGETMDRIPLARINTRVVSEVMASVSRYTRDAILIVVTNPLDIAVYRAQHGFDYPEHKIIGTGTLLDTARLRRIIAKRYAVDTKNVHGYVLGEHGESAFVDWSLVNIAGAPLPLLDTVFPNVPPLDKDAVLQEVKQAGFEILKLKGYTSAGIAMSVSRLIKAVVLNEESILPVSTTLNGEYGIRDVALSIPCVITNEGVSHKLVLPLSAEESEQLHASAEKLSAVLEELNLRN